MLHCRVCGLTEEGYVGIYVSISLLYYIDTAGEAAEANGYGFGYVAL